ncbi:MAG: hypothetical protein AB7O56_10420 [Bauldia sp.]
MRRNVLFSAIVAAAATIAPTVAVADDDDDRRQFAPTVNGPRGNIAWLPVADIAVRLAAINVRVIGVTIVGNAYAGCLVGDDGRRFGATINPFNGYIVGHDDAHCRWFTRAGRDDSDDGRRRGGSDSGSDSDDSGSDSDSDSS